MLSVRCSRDGLLRLSERRPHVRVVPLLQAMRVRLPYMQWLRLDELRDRQLCVVLSPPRPPHRPQALATTCLVTSAAHA